MHSQSYDDEPRRLDAPDLWANAPTLHFSTSKPITRDDLLAAVARGETRPPTYGFDLEP